MYRISLKPEASQSVTVNLPSGPKRVSQGSHIDVDLTSDEAWSLGRGVLNVESVQVEAPNATKKQKKDEVTE